MLKTKKKHQIHSFYGLSTLMYQNLKSLDLKKCRHEFLKAEMLQKPINKNNK